MIILLVRHGETENNVLGMGGIVGNDAHLNDKGIEQAKLASRICEPFEPKQIYSSSFLRCQQTTDYIAKANNLSVQLTEDLKEFYMGDWANLKSAETKDLLMQNDAWNYSPSKFGFRVPGGESWEDVAIRVKQFLKTLQSYSATGTVVLVSHNATIRALVGVMREAHFKDWFGFPLFNGAVSGFEYKNGKYQELFINKQKPDSI